MVSSAFKSQACTASSCSASSNVSEHTHSLLLFLAPSSVQFRVQYLSRRGLKQSFAGRWWELAQAKL